MIQFTLLNIIGTAILGNFIAHWFSPIQSVKGRVLRFLSFLPFINFISETLNCSKCSSFWLGLLLFQNIFVAALCALLGYLINHLIDRVEVWYE